MYIFFAYLFLHTGYYIENVSEISLCHHGDALTVDFLKSIPCKEYISVMKY